MPAQLAARTSNVIIHPHQHQNDVMARFRELSNGMVEILVRAPHNKDGDLTTYMLTMDCIGSRVLMGFNCLT